MPEFLQHLRDRVRRTPALRPVAAILDWELGSLALLLLGALGLWVFAEVADEVGEGQTAELDRALILALRADGDPSDPLGPTWIEEAGRDLTALGGVTVLALFTGFTAALLLLQGKRRAAAFVLVAIAGGQVASTLMKLGFDRPRPDLVPHGSAVHTASFPSGHSMLAAVTYLTIGAVLMRTQGRRRIKAFVLAAATLLTVLVGVSRVYLGVHWPTDVLAGWTAGAAWAGLCWIAARELQVFGQVERAADEA